MKPIFNITPFSALDYAEHLSAIIWFSGCNMRCAYCYNREIVEGEGNYTFSHALEFLKKRQNLLDAVVLSGGEATGVRDLLLFATKIKNLGFKIKLDTNGSNPEVLRSLLKEKLLNYVALDFKGDKNNFQKITKIDGYNHFLRSLQLLTSSDIEYEVRTTYHSDLFNEKTIETMLEILKEYNYKKTFHIQLAREENSFQDLKETKELNIHQISKKFKINIR